MLKEQKEPTEEKLVEEQLRPENGPNSAVASVDPIPSTKVKHCLLPSLTLNIFISKL